ncbi:PH domain-containing protein [Marilutibacter alkalisoli]|uniref:PH domain-containing protein n=1 Tax=Marilutibacter alkalisoli TaxID=2591633 RepID=A0A514BV47_9GAMM|nr:PH domain-containing protein [Lysobacter alkalisoli]QDH71278.1 PH domain-containing protein [Lysobacter alkalisoli]
MEPLELAPSPAADTDWNPLPPRARPLFLLGGAIWMTLSGGVAGLVLALLGSSRIDAIPRTALVMAGIGLFALAGAAIGLWLGHKAHRYTFWRLDGEGLAVRRGRLWQRETRVPVTRVQHLDLKRGPWQRRRALATLVVHTAGTAHGAVSVPNLDLEDAEHLRDTLGRQIDRDDD